jgi:hypothetical protein
VSLQSQIKASINNLSKYNKKTEVYSIAAGRKAMGARGVVELKKRIRNQPVLLIKAAKRGLLEAGLEAFEKSMDLVPVDTGKLARSGRLAINNVIYAKGESDGDNTGVTLVQSPDRSLTPTKDDIDALAGGTLNLSISFWRVDEEGNDLALRLHEELQPRGSGPAQAKKGSPPRGGKFIEGPLQEVKKRLLGPITKEMQAALKTLK